MGGIADYSGSLVLELPLAVATFVAAQETGGEEVVIESDQLGDPGGGGARDVRRSPSWPRARRRSTSRRRGRCSRAIRAGPGAPTSWARW